MSEENLHVPSKELIKQELLKQTQTQEIEKKEIMTQADGLIQSILTLDLDNIQNKQSSINQLESIGTDIQYQAGKQSEMLKQPIMNLSKRGEDGGDVANALIDLKVTVESLDPAGVDLAPGWFSRLLGYIPGVGTSLKRYLTKFESAQTVIAAIVRSLEAGRDQLIRDNITLAEDQKQIWVLEKKLEEKILFASTVDQKLEEQSTELNQEFPEKVKFIGEFMVFPLRQRIIDLQQQLAVQQQTLIATEIIIRNNKELTRGVNRALNVTISALQNATTIALALSNQQKVLEKVDKINETTSKLIADSAKRLKTQGVAIQKGAASAQIDINSLKSAMNDLNTAIDDISNYRLKALPEMSAVIKDLDKLIKETQEPLKKIEKLQE